MKGQWFHNAQVNQGGDGCFLLQGIANESKKNNFSCHKGYFNYENVKVTIKKKRCIRWFKNINLFFGIVVKKIIHFHSFTPVNSAHCLLPVQTS